MINIEKEVIDCKTAIIDSDGIVHVMGRVNEARYHIKYLLDYLNDNYPNINKSSLTLGSARDKYGYFFGKLGNILYFNDGLTGMFYFPKELTDLQLETMDNLSLGNQKVAICFDLKDNGSINSRMVGLEGNLSVHEALEAYIQKNNKRGSFRR